MTKRIFSSICLSALTVFLACAILIMGALYEYFSDIQRTQLNMQTGLAAQGVAHEGLGYFHGLNASDYRITWIGSDGSVLYDSALDTSGMENHLEREEIINALASGHGESIRYSSTLTERFFYSAQKLPDGSILRLSVSQSSIFALILGMIKPIAIICLTAVALSVFLAVRISRNIVKPLNTLNLDQPLSNKEYDELSPLLKRIDSQQKQLRRQESQLYQRQKELDIIIGSMSEGMVLLNPKGKIISINPAAGILLETAPESGSSPSLRQDQELQKLFTKALQGKQASQVIKLGHECYRADANPIISRNAVMGIALFLFNITEKETAEQLRREFTANVSHELKTPLHSISGYAELLKNNLVRQEDIVPFAAKIYSEAQRMVHLIQDIISLSHLDEGETDVPRECLDLYESAQKALQGLEAEAKSLAVSLKLTGCPVFLNGIPHLIYSIIYNLCDNGIKYNRKNGSVSVNIRKEETKAVLSVCDTGIGIAPEHQERIFERFYRVDKSHSKEVGGTGLGLSIVKHAAKIHQAKIQVISAAGQGTEIMVTFPLEKFEDI